MAVKVGNVSQEVEKNEDVVAEIKQPQIVITFKQIVLCIMIIHTGLYAGLIFQVGFGWNLLALTIIQLACTIAVYFNCWEIMLGYLIKHAYYQIRVFLEFAPVKNWFLEMSPFEMTVKVGNFSQTIEKNGDAVADSETKDPEIVVTFKEIILFIMSLHAGIYVGTLICYGFNWNLLQWTFIQITCTLAFYINFWELMLLYLIKQGYYQILFLIAFHEKKRSNELVTFIAVAAELLFIIYFSISAQQTWVAYKFRRQERNKKKIEKEIESKVLNVV
ncbi:unnamed protein product [Caenorhabditis angaria]|uniref:Uncharacterized protein n=1 Tax=Caenorhabditis angaria TaxID=860376 RepID=A0A9P1IXC9_9PELO|nr:unnamed protein product [Caenorhabditis angaria]